MIINEDKSGLSVSSRRNGEGIKQKITTCFERFYKADQSFIMNLAQQIGLSIAARISRTEWGIL